MTDRFDDAKRALEEVPAPDLWPEAERRAAAGSVVPLDDAPGQGDRRPGRWLAAAAIALVAGAVGLVVRDDDPEVRTDPTGEGTVVPLVGPTSDFPAFDGRCPFALDGDGPHQVIADGQSPWFPADSQPVEQHVVQLQLGAAQTAEIAVPGVVLTDLVGERVEDVELARGTGAVWFSPDFVQARWFTGSQEPCESFTVTVWGGTEDGNRHAAVDLAEQVRLPSDLLAVIDRTIAGDWVLAGATLDGDELAVEPVGFGFADGRASWDTGCNQASGAYQVVGAAAIRVPDPTSTALPCPNSAQATAIEEVMGSDAIALSTTADSLVLRDDSVVDGSSLTLRRAADDARAATEPTLFETTSGCTFGISGAPVFRATDGDQPPRLDSQRSVRLAIGQSQNALVHVPGYVVRDLVGERVEDIELERGTAQLWLAEDFVQVRWFPGSEEPCSSFAVTVASSEIPATTGEDENRRAAIELAGRLLLPADLSLPVTYDPIDGDWQLESATTDGVSIPGDELAFLFTDGQASWSDGCTEFTATYVVETPTSVSLHDLGGPPAACPAHTMGQAVAQVMGADVVEVVRDGTTLILRSPTGDELELRPIDTGTP